MNSNLRTMVYKMPHDYEYGPDKFNYTEWTFDSTANASLLVFFRAICIHLPVKTLNVDFESIKTNSVRLVREMLPIQFAYIPIDQSAPVGTEYQVEIRNRSEKDLMWIAGKHIVKTGDGLGPERICNSNLLLAWLDPSTELRLKATVVESHLQSRMIMNSFRFDFHGLREKLKGNEYLDNPKTVFYEVQKNGQVFSEAGCTVTVPSNGLITIEDLFMRVHSIVDELLDQWKDLLVNNFGRPKEDMVQQVRPISAQVGEQTVAYQIQLPDRYGHLCYCFSAFLDTQSKEKHKFESIFASFDLNKQEASIRAMHSGTVADFATSMAIVIEEFRAMFKNFNCPK